MTYKLVGLDGSFMTVNGSVETPIMTLADEYGGRSQIAIDDGCYVLYNDGFGFRKNVYNAVVHWYKEAVHALRIYPKIKPYYKMGFIETSEFLT